LKSTGSGFEGFIRDEYTTLIGRPQKYSHGPNSNAHPDVDDRIFSTAIDLNYSIKLPDGPLTIDGLGAVGDKAKFGELQKNIRKITLETFATDESASVQVS
jgi:urate oxidase